LSFKLTLIIIQFSLFLSLLKIAFIIIKMKKTSARTYVIEEDEHLENLRKIIKRDFFASNEKEDEKII
jgi:hypothetical protein